MYWTAAVQPQRKLFTLYMEKRSLSNRQRSELWAVVFALEKTSQAAPCCIFTDSWWYGLVPGSTMPGLSNLSLFRDEYYGSRSHKNHTLCLWPRWMPMEKVALHEHQWNERVDEICGGHVRTMATWIHHFRGHGNPSTVQDWAPKQMTIAHEAKEVWLICLTASYTVQW